VGTATPMLPRSGAHSKRLDVQGLRAIAVLAVMAFHAGLPVSGGFIGVDVFFVISGFVITQLLIREYDATGRIRLRTFYWRRFKRLAPALSMMLAVCLLAAIPLLSPFGTQQAAATTAVAATFSLANILIARTFGDYFAAAAESNLFLNTWSLSVEEQFYLVFPALLVATWVIGRRVKFTRLFGLLAVTLVSVVSFGAAVVGASGYSLDRYFWLLGFFSPVTRAWEFGAGALVALVCQTSAQARLRRLSTATSIVGATLVAGSLVLLSDATPWPSSWTLIPVCGTAFILFTGESIQSGSVPIVTRALSSRPLVRVGDASYSLYLWHWPFIVLAVATWGGSLLVTCLAVVASILPALASYRWLENPLRFAQLQRPNAKILLITLVLSMPLLLAGLVNRGAELQWGLPAPERPLFGAGSSALVNCMRYARQQETSPLLDEACLMGDAESTEVIYLVGDSQAAQWADALDEVGKSVGASVRVATAPGCPFLDVYMMSSSGMAADDRACRENYENTLSLLLGLPPGDVVVAQAPGYWIDDEVRAAISPSGLSSETSKLTILNEGMAQSVSSLEQVGHRVIVVEPLLALASLDEGPMPSSCSTLMLAHQHCFRPVPESALSSQRATLDGFGDSLAGTDAATVNLLDLQCPDEICGLWSGALSIYADNSHVSAEFSRFATPAFLEAISRSPRKSQ